MSKSVIKGVAISQGVGIGGILVIKTPAIIVNKGKISPEKVDDEITNLEVAVCKTYIEIYDLYDGFSEVLTEEEKRILDVYNAILDDIYFFEELKDVVRQELYTAEHAIDICVKKYIAEIDSGDNEYVKQRIADLNDIRNRLIRNVFSDSQAISYDNINASHIVVMRELNPAVAVTLCKKKVQGVVVQDGAGFLSHAAIILRGAGIPVLNGADYNILKTHESQLAILDGFDGIVLADPDDPEIERYRESYKVNYALNNVASEKDLLPLETLDKHRIGLSINISNIGDYKVMKNRNTDGIGLVRTETLFISRRKMPSERRQTIVYSALVKGMNEKPVVIRTVDIGGDKIPGSSITISDFQNNCNRGIKWSLSHVEDFEIQLRSIIRASGFGQVKISFPMVDSANELALCKKHIDKALIEVSQEVGRELKKIKIGAVVETRLAVENIDEILANVDFISIGTNDLLNQIMGLNRKNLGSEIREYFEPKFIQVLSGIISKAKELKIPVSVCGEMASDPLAAVILIGLGTDDLSIAPSGISIIKRTIRELYFDVATELVERVLECKDINEVMLVLSGFIDCRF